MIAPTLHTDRLTLRMPVLADFGLRFVFIVLLLSGLSFLGLGVQPPNADWGSLVRENLSGLHEGAPAVLMPALAGLMGGEAIDPASGQPVEGSIWSVLFINVAQAGLSKGAGLMDAVAEDKG